MENDWLDYEVLYDKKKKIVEIATTAKDRIFFKKFFEKFIFQWTFE